ncbi:MAG: hypothetical protein KGY80_09725 [Candidatus Thorarchaeota archaeon]|nr:hypothetical protein [Candidatus Thorarchaeota archaeon]
MIHSVQLLDLRNLQVLAKVSYVKEETEETTLEDVLAQFYEVFEKHAPDSPFITSFDSKVAYVSPLSESTVLVCLGDKEPRDKNQLHRIRRLGNELVEEYEKKSGFDSQAILNELADRFLLKDIRLLFFSSRNPTFTNRTGRALAKLSELKQRQESAFAGPFTIGPYRVQCITLNTRDSVNDLSPCEIGSVDVGSIVFSETQTTEETVERLAKRLHSELSVPILIVPGSDKELQACRGFEERFDLMLCDSASDDPIALILSVLAIAGFSDMHPELAMQRWRIESLEPATEPEETVANVSEPDGHQEFLVIDKKMAETRYAYLYEEATEHQRAPNVIAAISTFHLDRDSEETFVIRTGQFGYAIIEQDDLLFTLITGPNQDLEHIRSRFSRLPALYLEDPPPPLSNPSNLYEHTPFTLKLLATIPPYHWPSREVPARLDEPDWGRFRYPMMKNFLRAIWDSVNGENELEDITLDDQSKMTLGGLYFLRRMGAIETKLSISPDDIPILLKKPEDEFMKRYNEMEEILEMINGENSLDNIAEATNIEISIVTHLFTQMHKRGFVDFTK